MSACIVTGAAAGNGLAIARRLLHDGHYVIGVDRSETPTEAASEVIQGDILDEGTMNVAFSKAIACSEGEVYLVNNAGITVPEFPQSDSSWNKTIDVNLKAPFQWSRLFSNYVIKGSISSGGIVFIGSLATSTGFPRNPSYHATKAGVLGLTRSFAFDLGGYGIRANCVSPGYINTAMTQNSYTTPDLHEARRKHTLLGRWGQPKDVANAVSFLCGPDSAYISGINLPVDGGWLANGLIE